ncbi:MAG: SUMF1/EgtB/PvdO family nonheme iron enzyme [Deltaproteobacteria bacterium]|nr:SUMF1/EgtB/PvdO family nonheme iron enzyme [Deltaproteobacteria bacterium]
MRAAGLALVVCLGGACGGGAAHPCELGQDIACTGPAGCAGVQTCASDGSGYGPCRCATSDAGLDAPADDAAPTPDGAADGPGLPADAPATDAAVDAAADASPTGCPVEMVAVPLANLCVDRYEASPGTSGAAASIAGALPWTGVNWDEAQAACAAAGKRLCTGAEWSSACRGPAPGLRFPYGDTYDGNACNGHDHGVDAAVPTGSLSTCQGGYAGLYDLSGNVSEWTTACSSSFCNPSGGSFLDGQLALACGSAGFVMPTTRASSIGFRCCRAP